MAKSHRALSLGALTARYPAVREPTIAVLIVTIFAFLALFVVLPLLMVFKASMLQDGQITLARWSSLFTNPNFIMPLRNSLQLGVAAAIAGTLVGYAMAYVVAMTGLPFKRLFNFVATLPMVSPPFMVALAAIMLFGTNGLITRGLLAPMFGAENVPTIYGFWGLLIVETLTYFPTAFLLMVSVFYSIDPVLEEAAQNQGAGRFQVFRDVIFPLSIPGILSSMLLIFIESIADFGNPLILSGDFKVLSVEAYLKITGEYDTSGGALMAILLLIPSLIAFLIQKYYVDRKSFATLTGKPSSSKRRATGFWGPAASFTVAISISAAILLFYASVVYGSLVKTWGADNTLTFSNYLDAFSSSWDALRDSMYLSAISTPITGIFGMVAAYLLVRKQFPGRGLMEFTSLLTFAVPGTVVGIGYILAFNDPPIQLTGTAMIIILLMVFRNAPLGIQSGMAAIRQLDRSIEEGSANLGADSITTFRRIILPLISPAFFSGLAHAFVRSMTAISAVIFVVSGQWNLVTVSILGFVENSYLSRASAMCMILVIFVSAVLGLMNFAVSRMGVRRG